jgi:surface protein
MKHRISHKKYNGHRVYRNYYDPYNPLDLPPYTIRVRVVDGVIHPSRKGTAVQVSTSPNIWDVTYEDSNWNGLFDEIGTGRSLLLEVLGANSTNVTSMDVMFRLCGLLERVQLFDTSMVKDMQGMFISCSKLSTVPLFNTSNVTMINHMFANCTRLTTVPLFDTSKVTNMYESFRECQYLTSIPLFNTSNVSIMDYTFYGCPRVESGALALYQQASSQPNPPTSHYRTFHYCGEYTQTGSAELAQIPDDWK